MANGVLMVYTGHAEGASTVALGQVFRSLGRGLRVCVVQFADCGVDFLSLISVPAFRERAQWHGLSTVDADEPRTVNSGSSPGPPGWQTAKDAVESGGFELVVLDGLLELLKSRSVDEEEVIRCLVRRPEGVNVMITGNIASEALVEAADLVTNVTALK